MWHCANTDHDCADITSAVSVLMLTKSWWMCLVYCHIVPVVINAWKHCTDLLYLRVGPTVHDLSQSTYYRLTKSFSCYSVNSTGLNHNRGCHAIRFSTHVMTWPYREQYDVMPILLREGPFEMATPEQLLRRRLAWNCLPVCVLWSAHPEKLTLSFHLHCRRNEGFTSRCWG